MKISLPSVAALAAASLLFVSCSRKPAGDGPGQRPGGGASVPVLVAQAAARDVPVEIHAIGTVQA